MQNNNSQISVTEFKKNFLQLFDEIKNKHSSFVIIKRNLPIAKIVPLEEQKKEDRETYFGFMKGTVKINTNIVDYSAQADGEVKHD